MTHAAPRSSSTRWLTLIGCCVLIACGGAGAPKTALGPPGGAAAGGPGTTTAMGVAAMAIADAGLAPVPSPDAGTGGPPDAGKPRPDAAALTQAVDAGIFGSPRCAGAGLALCDDFENPAAGGAPDPGTWRVITSYSGQPSTQNRVTIDAEHVARGSHALHVHTETQDPVYLETLQLPSRDNGFYGRVLAYFAQDPGARSKGHWGAFVGLGKQDTQGQDIEVRIGGQFDILVVNYSPTDALQLSSSRDGYYDDGVKLPVGAWTCFEFQFAGASDELRVWMDGSEIERLHVTDWNQFGHGLVANWSPTYDRLRIGYQSWNADTPLDVWYDSVAIDTARIGCQR